MTPNIIWNNIIAFTIIQYHPTAMFAPQQCLVRETVCVCVCVCVCV